MARICGRFSRKAFWLAEAGEQRVRAVSTSIWLQNGAEATFFQPVEKSRRMQALEMVSGARRLFALSLFARDPAARARELLRRCIKRAAFNALPNRLAESFRHP